MFECVCVCVYVCVCVCVYVFVCICLFVCQSYLVRTHMAVPESKTDQFFFFFPGKAKTIYFFNINCCIFNAKSFVTKNNLANLLHGCICLSICLNNFYFIIRPKKKKCLFRGTRPCLKKGADPNFFFLKSLNFI